jgi:hypothetical protein
VASAQKSPEPAPTAVPQLNSDMFKIPYATPTYDVGEPSGKFVGGKSDLGQSGTATPKITLPNTVDLGKYQLELNVRRDDARARAALDSGETANINSSLSTPSQSVAPNYFGLTLTAPTH